MTLQYMPFNKGSMFMEILCKIYYNAVSDQTKENLIKLLNKWNKLQLKSSDGDFDKANMSGNDNEVIAFLGKWIRC